METAKQLLLATHNAGKLRELRQLLSNSGYQLLGLEDVPQLSSLEVEESGDTYQANAQLKAVAYGAASHLLTLAEDSGLEVAALNNFPGIYSERWLKGSYENKNIVLLSKLDQLGANTNRSARFINVTCLYNPSNQSCRFFQGELLGSIAPQPSGTDGFGYDSIFIPEMYVTTLAELGTETKNSLSARAQSMKQLSDFLLSL